MDDYRKFRYDYFGEFLSQDESDQGNKRNLEGSSDSDLVELNRITNDDPQQHNQPQPLDLSKPPIDDSLMDFITDYFQGDVSQDLTVQENCDDEVHEQDERMSQMNAFEYSSNSDTNTSIEFFTSDASMNEVDRNCSGSSGFCDTDLKSPPPEENYKILRRKSISYEILFTNSKEKNGQVKVHIIPNQSKQIKDNCNQDDSSNVGQSKQLDQKGKETVQQEHIRLRHRVQELERKLHCLEIESERIVGELSRIIERKNETILQLELELAGVKMEN